MKKMPSLFIREFENHHVVKCLNKVHPGCEWVMNGEGLATEKLDGTCCLIEDDKIYARYDFKKGRKLPEGAIPCQEAPDPITGHFPHWILCVDQPQYKYHIQAFERMKILAIRYNKIYPNGTYELCGVHFQSNPYNLDTDILYHHGDIVLEDVPRTYEGIRDYLENHYIEGIVFHRGNGEMCKIKRSDFGFEWNGKVGK